MTLAGHFVDSNLLTLLVVGSEGRDLISRHRRLREGYSSEDYDILLDLFRPAGGVFVMPNTLSETSRLTVRHGEAERSRLFRRFRSIIETSEEITVVSGARRQGKRASRISQRPLLDEF